MLMQHLNKDVYIYMYFKYIICTVYLLHMYLYIYAFTIILVIQVVFTDILYYCQVVDCSTHFPKPERLNLF